jgi:predicted dehydrogenase
MIPIRIAAPLPSGAAYRAGRFAFMTPSDPVRLALVGLGRMGRFHLGALAGVEEVEVAAVVEPSAESIAAAGTDLGGIPIVSEAFEVPDGARVEAWLISTPTPTHPALTRQALEAGLHVLCEKPLALDPEEGDALGRLAAARGLVLQVGFWRRYSPPWARARELILQGAIGRPLMVRLAQWDADPPPATFCDPEVSGGLAIDCGVHEYDLAEWLTGMPVERVQGHHLPLVDDALGTVGDVDNLVAVLHLAGGPIATVDLSRNSRFGDDVRTEVLGSKGALLIDTLPTGRLRLGTADGMAVVAGSEVEDAMAAGVAEQARAFAAAVRGRSAEIPDAAASARSVRIGLAVGESARTGLDLTVPSA